MRFLPVSGCAIRRDGTQPHPDRPNSITGRGIGDGEGVTEPAFPTHVQDQAAHVLTGTLLVARHKPGQQLRIRILRDRKQRGKILLTPPPKDDPTAREFWRRLKRTHPVIVVDVGGPSGRRGFPAKRRLVSAREHAPPGPPDNAGVPACARNQPALSHPQLQGWGSQGRRVHVDPD